MLLHWMQTRWITGLAFGSVATDCLVSFMASLYQSRRKRRELSGEPILGTIVPNMGTGASPSRLASALFGRTRRAILGLLYANPDQSYYLRQITRRLGVGHGATQRELNRLSTVGIVRRTVFGRQINYQAEPECPIFAELKSLIVKTVGIGDLLRSTLSPLRDRIQVAFIYGSFARGNWKQQSDVDVLVIGKASFDEVVSAIAPTQRTLGREINPAVYSPGEFGSKLRSGHHFLTTLMKQERIFLLGGERDLAGLGAVRVAHRARK